MGGSSSRSSTRRTYNTTNVNQQGDGANVYGTGNRVTVQRADALALDNIAKMLGTSVEKLLGTTETINADSLDAVTSTSSEAIQLAREVAQAGEEGTQDAMDFVANYTERAQVGNAAEATKTVMWVAAVAGITLVGIAWASKGGMKA